jgi:hypothetical protein
MANPTPNAFISAYKLFQVKKHTDAQEWAVLTRIEKKSVGNICLGTTHMGENEWKFFIEKDRVLNHMELLDIAAAIKTIEKRADTPSLYK